MVAQRCWARLLSKDSSKVFRKVCMGFMQTLHVLSVDVVKFRSI
jgi:hypothetical protein